MSQDDALNVWARHAAQCAEWQSIRDELIAAAQGGPVTAYQVTLKQRERMLARGEKLVTYEELEAAGPPTDPANIIGQQTGSIRERGGGRKLVPLTEQEKQRMILEASAEGAQAHAKQVVKQLELAWFGVPRCTFVQDGKRCLFTEGHARAGFDDGHLLGTSKTETPKAAGCAMHHPRYVPGCYGCDSAVPDNGMLGPVNVRLANLENRVEQLERCQTKHASDIDRLISKGTL